MTSSVSGLFLLDKPAGITSQTAVRRVCRLLGAKSAGHTGTLDPMATGVLPILVGRAAKASEYLTDEGKCYRARLLLGMETDTEDTSGTVLRTCDDIPSAARVAEVCATFVGKLMQTPPMYSAVRVGGKRLMELARKGVTVERTPREITVKHLTVTQISPREYELDIAVSKGTYIRTLCADIGKMLGCYGVMASLCRTEAAGFPLAQAHTLDVLEAMDEESRRALVLPLDAVFAHLAPVHLPPFFARLARNGQRLYMKKLGVSFALGSRVRLFDGDVFFALAEAREKEGEHVLVPLKQFDL